MLWLPDIFRGTRRIRDQRSFSRRRRRSSRGDPPVRLVGDAARADRTLVVGAQDGRRHDGEFAFPQMHLLGKELISIYNDAYKPLLGNKPEALGRPVPEVWPEIWDEIRPLSDKALAGEATFVEDMLLVVDRYGHPRACLVHVLLQRDSRRGRCGGRCHRYGDRDDREDADAAQCASAPAPPNSRTA